MFANMLLTFSLYCIIRVPIMIVAKSERLGVVCIWVCLSSYFCSMFIAYIMGLVWRFSDAGRFASGDELAKGAVTGPLYQVSNGRFISIFYLLTGILMGSMCLCLI